MIPAELADIRLFAYGTLRRREVQLALFGRALDGREDVLPGYRLAPLEITDPGVIATSGTAQHTMACATGDPRDGIPGIVFSITPAELAAADAYEVTDVRRVSVRLRSGTDAFVYLGARP
jgi:hypothetical protein